MIDSTEVSGFIEDLFSLMCSSELCIYGARAELVRLLFFVAVNLCSSYTGFTF